jgi:hypothetical protein
MFGPFEQVWGTYLVVETSSDEATWETLTWMSGQYRDTLCGCGVDHKLLKTVLQSSCFTVLVGFFCAYAS